MRARKRVAEPASSSLAEIYPTKLPNYQICYKNSDRIYGNIIIPIYRNMPKCAHTRKREGEPAGKPAREPGQILERFVHVVWENVPKVDFYVPYIRTGVGRML